MSRLDGQGLFDLAPESGVTRGQACGDALSDTVDIGLIQSFIEQCPLGRQSHCIAIPEDQPAIMRGDQCIGFTHGMVAKAGPRLAGGMTDPLVDRHIHRACHSDSLTGYNLPFLSPVFGENIGDWL